MPDPGVNVPEPMDAVLADLRGDGRIDSEGGFSMDRDKAREKMRQYQLAEPGLYVLLLVQAAVRKGAARIDFRIDTDDLRMAFDGAPFTVGDFDGIYNAMFQREASESSRALADLAMGLNAAMGLDPKWIDVKSGDGEHAARLVLRRGQPEQFGPLSPAVSGTRIHVRLRFRPGMLSTFADYVLGAHPTAVAIMHHCAYAGIPIFINGRQATDPGLIERPLYPETLGLKVANRGDLRCAINVQAHPAAPFAMFVVAGVSLQILPMLSFPAGVFAIVCDPSLRQAVSRFDVVEDDRYRAAVGFLEQQTVALVRQIAEDLRGEDPARAAVVRKWLRYCLFQRLSTFGAGPFESRGRWTGIDAVLAGAPVWRRLDGRDASLVDVLAGARASGHVDFVVGEPRPDLADGGGALFLAEDGDAVAFLEAVLERRLWRGDKRLESMIRRDENRRAMLVRKAQPVLGAGPWQARVPLSGDRLCGEAGMRRRGVLGGDPTSASRVSFLVDGCLLAAKSVALDLPPFEAVLEGSFQPDADWTGPAADDALAAGLLALFDALPDLCEAYTVSLPSQPPGDADRKVVLGCLAADRGAEGAAAFLRAFGFPKKTAERLARQRERAREAARGEAAVAASTDVLERTPVFRLGDGGFVSLADLRARAGANDDITFSRVAPAPLADFVPAPVVVSGDDGLDLRVLRASLGDGLPRDVTADVVAAKREHDFLRGHVEEVAPGVPCIATTSFADRGVQVAIGLPRGEAPDPVGQDGVWWRATAVRLLRRRRHCGEVRVVLPFRSLAITANCDDLALPEQGDGVVADEALARVVSVVRGGVVRFLEDAAAPSTAFPGDVDALNRFLLEAAAAAFPTRTFRFAFDLLRSGHPEGAVARYKEVLEAGTLVPAPRMLSILHHVSVLSPHSKAYRDARDDLVGTVLDLAVGRRIRGDEGPPGPERPDAGALMPGEVLEVLEPWFSGPLVGAGILVPAGLCDAPVFAGADGRNWSLSRMAATVASGGRVAWIPAEAPMEGTVADETAIRLLADPAVLERLLGLRWTGDVAGGGRPEARDAVAPQPRVTTLSFEDGRVVASRDFKDGALRGKLGLPRRHPSEEAGSRAASVGASTPPMGASTNRDAVVRIHVDMRPVADRRWTCGLALVALVDDGEVTVGPDGLPDAASLERIQSACERAAPPLYRTLAGQFDRLSANARTGAWRHLLDYVSYRAERNRRGAGPGNFPGVEKAVSAVKGFTGADGTSHSVDDVRRAFDAHGQVFVVPPGTRSGRPFDPSRLVLVADPYEVERLAELFGTVIDDSQRWAAMQRVFENGRRLDASPKMRDTYASVSFRFEGLEGTMWLPIDDHDPSGLSCMVGDVEVARCEVPGSLRCRGRIAGATLRLDEVPGKCVLTDAVQAALSAQVTQVVFQLAVRYQKRSLPAARMDRAQEILRQALARLEPLREPSGGWPGTPTGELGAFLDSLLGKEAALPGPAGDDVAHAPVAPEPMPAEPDVVTAAPVFGGALESASPTHPVEDPVPVVAPEPAVAPIESPEQRLTQALGELLEQVGALVPDSGVLLAPVEVVVEERRDGPPCRYEKGRLRLNARHRAVRLAMARHHEDPGVLSFLAAAACTAINLALDEVTDDHDEQFQMALARRWLDGRGTRSETGGAGASAESLPPST